MDDYFSIPVVFQENELEFEARVLTQGYIHRVEVIVDGILVLFEPDEERNYRALVDLGQLEGKGRNLNKGILQAIAGVLQSLPEV